ncbi:MAG: hypothetical protein AABM29_02415 [Actinomycetota bacterium]
MIFSSRIVQTVAMRSSTSAPLARPRPRWVITEMTSRSPAFIEFMRAWTEDFEGWSIEIERLIDFPGPESYFATPRTGIASN